jgi:HEAT repeat protein
MLKYYRALDSWMTDSFAGQRFSVRTTYAVAALGKIDEPAVDPLILALNDTNSSARREVAAEVLGEIGDPRAVDPLNAALCEEHLDVRIPAAKALREIEAVESAEIHEETDEDTATEEDSTAKEPVVVEPVVEEPMVLDKTTISDTITSTWTGFEI